MGSNLVLRGNKSKLGTTKEKMTLGYLLNKKNWGDKLKTARYTNIKLSEILDKDFVRRVKSLQKVLTFESCRISVNYEHEINIWYFGFTIEFGDREVVEEIIKCGLPKNSLHGFHIDSLMPTHSGLKFVLDNNYILAPSNDMKELTLSKYMGVVFSDYLQFLRKLNCRADLSTLEKIIEVLS